RCARRYSSPGRTAASSSSPVRSVSPACTSSPVPPTRRGCGRSSQATRQPTSASSPPRDARRMWSRAWSFSVSQMEKGGSPPTLFRASSWCRTVGSGQAAGVSGGVVGAGGVLAIPVPGSGGAGAGAGADGAGSAFFFGFFFVGLLAEGVALGSAGVFFFAAFFAVFFLAAGFLAAFLAAGFLAAFFVLFFAVVFFAMMQSPV